MQTSNDGGDTWTSTGVQALLPAGTPTASVWISDAGPLGFARMSGLSIAGRDAAPWVTDFLNAAYFRRPVDDRDVDDLRAVFCVLTTYWYRKSSGRRLHAADVRAFHRAYGRDRFDTEHSTRGTLTRDQLLTGGATLLGD